ncbi:MAG: HEAT repeat domain-containing protein [Armatimonadota bacterium]
MNLFGFDAYSLGWLILLPFAAFLWWAFRPLRGREGDAPAPTESIAEPRWLRRGAVQDHRKIRVVRLIARRTPEDIQELCQLAAEGEPGLAQEAARGLVRIGSPAVPRLAGSARAAGPAAQSRLVTLLGEIADPAAVPDLSIILSEARPPLREQVASALYRIARKHPWADLSPTTPTLRELVQSLESGAGTTLYERLLHLAERSAETRHLPLPGSVAREDEPDLPLPAREPTAEDLPLPQRLHRE